MQLNIRNGWIFSRREDIALFVFPFLAGWMLVALHQLFNLQSVRIMGKESLVIIFAMLAFLDAGHVFSTVFKSYFDRNTRSQKKFLLFVVPVLLYLVMVVLYQFFGMRTVLILFGYFNIYHIIRQQYGWVSISARKAGENSKMDFYLDRITIYAFMILPFVWIHFSLPPTEKQFIIPHNQLAADICRWLWLAVFASYWVRQAIKIFYGQPVNISKTIQMMVSFLAWGAVILFQSPVLLVITVFVHSVPYLGIIYKTKKSAFDFKYPLLIFLVIVLVVGTFYTKTNNFVKDLALPDIFGIPKAYFLFALLLFPLMHFTIDGVIWKKKNFQPKNLQ